MMRLLLQVTRFLKPHRILLALAFLGALGEAVADVLQPWPLKLLFDHIFNHQPPPPAISWLVTMFFSPGERSLIYVILLAVLGIAALGAAASYAQDYFLPRISHWVIHDLRLQLYWHIQR